MPPKVSNSKTEPKGGAKSRRGTPAADASASARAAKTAAAPEPAPAPKPPAEAVSLIEPKVKKVRKPEADGERKSKALPRIGISKIVAPAPKVEPEPSPVEETPVAPEPVAVVEAVPEPVADEAPVDDRKIIHIKP